MENVATPIKKYYKIQRFSRISMSWIDRQVAYATLEEAKHALPTSVKARIMVIEGKKRFPL